MFEDFSNLIEEKTHFVIEQTGTNTQKTLEVIVNSSSGTFSFAKALLLGERNCLLDLSNFKV